MSEELAATLSFVVSAVLAWIVINIVATIYWRNKVRRYTDLIWSLEEWKTELEHQIRILEVKARG